MTGAEQQHDIGVGPMLNGLRDPKSATDATIVVAVVERREFLAGVPAPVDSILDLRFELSSRPGLAVRRSRQPAASETEVSALQRSVSRLHHEALRPRSSARPEWTAWLLSLSTILLLVVASIVTPGPAHSVDLTEQEREWLHGQPTIRIGPAPNFAPVEYFPSAEVGHIRGSI